MRVLLSSYMIKLFGWFLNEDASLLYDTGLAVTTGFCGSSNMNAKTFKPVTISCYPKIVLFPF